MQGENHKNDIPETSASRCQDSCNWILATVSRGVPFGSFGAILMWEVLKQVETGSVHDSTPGMDLPNANEIMKE